MLRHCNGMPSHYAMVMHSGYLCHCVTLTSETVLFIMIEKHIAASPHEAQKKNEADSEARGFERWCQGL